MRVLTCKLVIVNSAAFQVDSLDAAEAALSKLGVEYHKYALRFSYCLRMC